MSDWYLGEVRLFAGNYAPEGWQVCDGSALQINTYQALYSLIGTTYGGNGTTTFNVPDLRGRLPVGQGQGTGLTARTIGQSLGASQIQIQPANMPSHSHLFNAVNSGGTSLVVSSGVSLAETKTLQGGGGTVAHYVPPAAAASTLTMAAGAVTTATGGGLTHTNVMPYLALQYIIAVTGLYPQRQ
jgi:microcystin-dependent protein